MLLDIETLRRHCRVEHNLDDAYLQSLERAAVAAFETHTGRELIAPGDTPADRWQIALNDDITHGLLLLICQWYEHRETTDIGNLKALPNATDWLWRNYRLYDLGAGAD